MPSSPRVSQLRSTRNTATDERKALWRKEQELVDARKTAGEQLESSRRTLQHSMSRPQWVAIEAVRRIAKEKKIKGLHGLVVELFETDPNYHTAVEVTAGNQLLQMVVDTDETATALLRELQRENVGRVTFMPLNRIRPGPDPPSPDASEAVPLMRYLNFAPKFKPAISEIFRKAMLVKNLEVGTRFTALGHTWRALLTPIPLVARGRWARASRARSSSTA